MIIKRYGRPVGKIKFLKDWWQRNAFKVIVLLFTIGVEASLIWALADDLKAQPVFAEEFRVQVPKKTEEQIKIEGVKETLDMYIAIYGLQADREAIYYTIQGESGWCANLKGDLIHGKYHAEGCWMIWQEYHPELSKACINDFKCATEFVMKKWKAEHYDLWTCARDFYEGKKVCNQK
jgi:hypothetical protein